MFLTFLKLLKVSRIFLKKLEEKSNTDCVKTLRYIMYLYANVYVKCYVERVECDSSNFLLKRRFSRMYSNNFMLHLHRLQI